MEIHQEQNHLAEKYVKFRSLLERACKDLTAHESIQFSNLFSRLNYICDKYNLNGYQKYWINAFRINANQVLQGGLRPVGDCPYASDLRALCDFGRICFELDIPAELLAAASRYKDCRTQVPRSRKSEKTERIRVEVSSADEHFIYAFDEEHPTEEPIRIKHHVPGINEEFNDTVAQLWKGCQLNLVDVIIDEEGIYIPDLIILEPDYLLDISSLAECMKEYGKHPLNFIQSRFEPAKNTKHMLLGNIANMFLDEFVNEKQQSPVVYANTIRKAFKSAPFEFATCEGIDHTFFQDTQVQFQNIKNIVNNTFPEKHIDRENAILEPSFICEHLGVQGRLDYLQLQSSGSKKFVIELKSGKAPFPDTNIELIGLNHRSQAFIYQIMIQKVLGVQFKDLSTFILYSRYTDPTANLRLTAPFMAAIKEIMNIRNLIVANESCIARDATETQTRRIVGTFTPETLITNGHVKQSFLENYIIPQIEQFSAAFKTGKAIELAYFHSFYAFVAKEHYISKAGDTEYTSSKGISSLWLSALADKIEAGEILTDLTIKDNLTETDSPAITLSIPGYEHNFLPNFRQGDIVILYERNTEKDNVTNKQVFKGAVQCITPTEITIRVRYKQRNQHVLPVASKYAVEHDFLDSSYNAMYRGLYAFLHANQDRKDLLLHQRLPVQDTSRRLNNHYISPEVNEIILKAKQANDLFLLVGPPGTGKTSIALKSMVEEFYSEPGCNILLLSYTNRAVDEICEALDTVQGQPPYVRIGSELSCDPKHKTRLLDKLIRDCDTREKVKAAIERYRIYVGTVASLSGKNELFKLKHFQVAIIDEASQILEPGLLGILSAKNVNGGNAIEKFILVGDQKQLPAVVLQREEQSRVNDPLLQQAGLINRNKSIFERLYHLHKSDKNSPVWGMLHKQGRMHPDIALFPNYSFYNSQLDVVPTPHQTAALEYSYSDINNPFHQLITRKRLAFIPSEKHSGDKSAKTNTYEAQIVTALVKQIYDLYQQSFSAEKTVGIITPYRSQIALIRRVIHELGIPALDAISIDTVERFQGSQRDIIIYSFCINQFHQLDFLANNIEDEGQIIDRKLNVAITRAKKQLFVIGNPTILSNNLTYYRFIEFIRSKYGYIPAQPDDFLAGRFNVPAAGMDIETGNKVYELPADFVRVFKEAVAGGTLHRDADYIRLNVLSYGRANFDQGTLEISAEDKVDLYCHYEMRRHYCSALAVFSSFNDYFSTAFSHTGRRVTFIDIGCGPLTSGLAFQESFAKLPFDYIGVDISNAMLNKARTFSKSGLFSRDTKFLFINSLNEVTDDYWNSTSTLSGTVILNFAYLFPSISKEETERLSVQTNTLLDKYPLNKFIVICQNPAIEKRNRNYSIFKKLVPRLSPIASPKTQTVGYLDALTEAFDRSETVYYELLSS